MENALPTQTPFPSSHINQICVWGRISDVFLVFEFHQNRLKNVGAVGVEISAFALTWHIAYTTACCYHTSRDYLCTPPHVKRRSSARSEN